LDGRPPRRNLTGHQLSPSEKKKRTERRERRIREERERGVKMKGFLQETLFILVQKPDPVSNKPNQFSNPSPIPFSVVFYTPLITACTPSLHVLFISITLALHI